MFCKKFFEGPNNENYGRLYVDDFAMFTDIRKKNAVGSEACGYMGRYAWFHIFSE